MEFLISLGDIEDTLLYHKFYINLQYEEPIHPLLPVVLSRLRY